MDYRAIPKPGRTVKTTVKNAVVNLKPTDNQKKTRRIVPAKKPLPVKTQKLSASIQRSSKKVVEKSTTLNTVRKKAHIITKPKRVVQQKRAVVTKTANLHSRKINRRKSIIDSKSKKFSTSKNQFRSAINGLKGKGRGKILIILANGPSLMEVEIEKLKNHPAIDMMCINKPDMRVWPTTYWGFSDQSQYKRHTDLFNSYANLIINSTAVKARRANNQIVVRGLNGNGFSRDLLRGFHIGRSTVYANMQTALWMDYDHVYIFGIDMCKVGGKLHFYGENPDVKPDVREERFKKEADNYERAYKIMKPGEKRFTMCSAYNPWPFAEKFGKMDHKKAIPHILELANQKLEDQKKLIILPNKMPQNNNK